VRKTAEAAATFLDQFKIFPIRRLEGKVFLWGQWHELAFMRGAGHHSGVNQDQNMPSGNRRSGD
jgi:hypothetical protein